MRATKVIYPTLAGLGCASAIILGLNAVSGNQNVASADSGANVVAAQGEVQASSVPAQLYSINANGQSFGSELSAADPSQAPDLISAYGVDGTLGYVKKTDLMAYQLASPAVSRKLALEQFKGADIPLYASDGITLVGIYHISASAG